MLIALNLIKSLVDKPLTAEGIQNALTHSGFVVEHIHTAGGTEVLDVEVTSNRPDCLSHFGIARELAALAGGKFILPALPHAPVPGIAADAPVAIVISLEAPDQCPYYSVVRIDGVRVGPSPRWLADAVVALGMRSINNVVDVTNYVLMQTGQPLHAFDRTRLTPGPVVIRRAAAGEKISLINGQTAVLSTGDLLIADYDKPLALAGVMGGAQSEVSAETVSVLLESAQFDAAGIRETARRLGITSDSARRFERGIDPAMAVYARRWAAELIMQVAGGTVVAAADVGLPIHRSAEVRLRLSRFTEIIGIPIPAETALGILSRLEFSPRTQDGAIACTVPGFRSDVTREIDVIEELLRIWGYEHVPVAERLLHAMPAANNHLTARRLMRRTLAGAGWHEIVSFTFVDPAEAMLFAPSGYQPLKVDEAVRKANNILRPSVLPGLLAAIRHNQNNGEASPRLFELAQSFQTLSDQPSQPLERTDLAITGTDISEVIGCIELVVSRLAPAAKVRLRPVAAVGFAPGTSGQIIVTAAAADAAEPGDATPTERGANEYVLGVAGVVAPQVQQYYELRKATAAAEMHWSLLEGLFNPRRLARPIHRFPAVRRDLSLIVNECVAWRQIEEILDRMADPAMRAGAEFVGTYRGKPIDAGKKSVTFELIFRGAQGSLRSEAVDAQMVRIMDAMTSELGAQIRR